MEIFFLVFSVSLDSGKPSVLRVYIFLARSHALFTGPASTRKRKSNFKTGFHGISHTFKNYFDTVFLVFNNKRYPNRLSVKQAIILASCILVKKKKKTGNHLS